MEERDPQTGAIIGAAMEVHNWLGHGFLESVYHDAITVELRRCSIPFHREVALPVMYKDEKLASMFRADLICYGEVIVELKALSALAGKEKAQLLNYLKATGLKRGLLLNFGAPRLQVERLVLNF